MRIARLLLLTLCCFGGTSLFAALPQPVVTSEGLLRGSSSADGELSVFMGVPYAAPPVGANRWREPQPLPPWSGIREALAAGPRCVQRGFEPGSEQPLSSEDCLYLNIWTPADSAGEQLPVMLWIHGGGFFVGSGSDARYDGAALAQKGAVVVTINYRLGSFGFFAHPALSAESPHHSSGNYALLDMLAAARWVQENIGAFGGDPGNVTLMGESAGGNAVSNLIASPLSAGLFQRAILQSGGWLGWLQTATSALPTLAQREAAGEAQADSLGVAGLKALRALSTREVLEKFSGSGAINVDGYLLPEDPALIFAAGEQQPVDLLAGSNRDEAIFFGPGIGSSAEFQDYAEARFDSRTGRYLKLYPAADDAGANASYLQAHTDHLAWQMRSSAHFQSTLERQAWVYFFTHVPPGQEARGATHVAELDYVFKHPADNWNETDQALAEAMSSYWVNFARSGNPNGQQLPRWPAYRHPEPGTVQVLGDSIESEQEQVPQQDALRFFDEDFRLFVRERK